MAAASYTRALGSPDIVALLAEYLTKDDLVCLARVAKCCFASTIHLIWSEVWGIHNLLALVPGAIYEKEGETDNWKIIVPDLASSDLTRFRFYAAHVFRLHILPRKQKINYQTIGWKHLLTYRKSSVLFPNLRVIVSSCNSQDETFLRWVTLLLCPTVATLYTHSPRWKCVSLMSMASVSRLLEHLSEHSRAIEDLSIFPVDPYTAEPSMDNEDEDNRNDCTSGELDAMNSNENRHGFNGHLGSSYEHLKQLTNLHHLTTNYYVLNNEALSSLAALPFLEKITLADESPNQFNREDSAQYPDLPFPSLHSLEVFLPELASIKYIWSQSALVYRLTEVKIIVYVRLRGVNSETKVYAQFEPFISTICEQSPNIQQFTMGFGYLGRHSRVTIKCATLRNLVKLPLTKLDLRDARIKNLPQACKILGQCDSLRKFRLPSHALYYQDCLAFVPMANLERLHVSIHSSGFLQTPWLLPMRPVDHPNTRLRFLEAYVHLIDISKTDYHVHLTTATSFFATQFRGLEYVTWISDPSFKKEVCISVKENFPDMWRANGRSP